MLVLSMNQKRQRRPNVRLEEIGDFPAAFACGFSPKSRVNSVHKRWKHEIGEFSEVENDSDTKQELGEIDVAALSTGFNDDMVCNRENKDPNLSKLLLDVPSFNQNGMAKSELDFGSITRKCRIMRRRGRSANGNNRIFAFAWELGHGPSTEDGQEFCGSMLEKMELNMASDENASNEINDFSCHENSPASIEDSEHNRHSSEAYDEHNNSENWSEHGTSEGKPGVANDDGDMDTVIGGGCHDEHNRHSSEAYDDHSNSENWSEHDTSEGKAGVANDDGDMDTVIGGGCHDGVRRWLEEQGFSNYINVFELHEVDEESLPMLTFRDLKEMGILAVGPRRKLYNAIRRLRDAS